MSETISLRCPTCGVANRVPARRLSEQPKCGRCHAALFTGEPLTLDQVGFERLVATEELPLLVDFWAPWCGPCLQMAPAFAEAARSLEPEVRFAKVDTEAVPELAARFGIRGIPTLILFLKGREIARQPGATSAAGIIEWVRTASLA